MGPVASAAPASAREPKRKMSKKPVFLSGPIRSTLKRVLPGPCRLGRMAQQLGSSRSPQCPVKGQGGLRPRLTPLLSHRAPHQLPIPRPSPGPGLWAQLGRPRGRTAGQELGSQGSQALPWAEFTQTSNKGAASLPHRCLQLCQVPESLEVGGGLPRGCWPCGWPPTLAPR